MQNCRHVNPLTQHYPGINPLLAKRGGGVGGWGRSPTKPSPENAIAKYDLHCLHVYHICAKHIMAKARVWARMSSARVCVCWQIDVRLHVRDVHMCVAHVRLHGRGRTTELQNTCHTSEFHITFAPSTYLQNVCVWASVQNPHFALVLLDHLCVCTYIYIYI